MAYSPKYDRAVAVWLAEISAFIAFSHHSQTKVIVSNDGTTWSQMTITPTAGYIMGVAWNPAAKRIVVSGYGSGIMSSGVADVETTTGSYAFGSTTLKETHVAPLFGATTGAAVASKALLVDANRSVNNINELSATRLKDQVQTPAQPLITSLGRVSALSVTGDVKVGSTTVLETDIAKIDAVTNGHASPNKALVVDANYDITDINEVAALKLSGVVQTGRSPTSRCSARRPGVKRKFVVGGTIVSENEIVHLDGAKAGTAASLKDMITVSANSIGGVNEFSAVKITGQLQTANQPLITSIDKLSALTDIAKLDAVANGVAASGKPLVLNTNLDVADIHSLSATDLTGTLTTAAQPFVSSVNVLDVTGHDSDCAGLKRAGVLVTASAEDLNFVDTIPGSAEASKALVLNNDRDIDNIRSLKADELAGTLTTAAQPHLSSVLVIDVARHNGEDAGLRLVGELETSTAAELNYTNTIPGVAQASKVLGFRV
ncbi:hypothetical protein P3T76_007016 [Phytophthora citrophthora]|uniref:Peptidase S74 domain-containing protein n=1 Tax=Phytophthora citrophthora TaxID=4793 RepID=A0AAD9LLK9_9STRA|nr:hypothetical protein P3T76_007016 [Phytophthora citrophthora]